LKDERTYESIEILDDCDVGVAILPHESEVFPCPERNETGMQELCSVLLGSEEVGADESKVEGREAADGGGEVRGGPDGYRPGTLGT
jgi:hypothetical protein